MLAKRIIAVLTFEDGEHTDSKFLADYTYTKNFINNTLFDGIVLIDISKSDKKRKLFYKVVENFAKIVLFLFVLVVKLKLFLK